MSFRFVKTLLLSRSNLDGFSQKSVGCKFETIIKFEIIVELLNSEIINLKFDGVSMFNFLEYEVSNVISLFSSYSNQ